MTDYGKVLEEIKALDIDYREKYKLEEDLNDLMSRDRMESIVKFKINPPLSSNEKINYLKAIGTLSKFYINEKYFFVKPMF